MVVRVGMLRVPDQSEVPVIPLRPITNTVTLALFPRNIHAGQARAPVLRFGCNVVRAPCSLKRTITCARTCCAPRPRMNQKKTPVNTVYD